MLVLGGGVLYFVGVVLEAGLAVVRSSEEPAWGQMQVGCRPHLLAGPS